MEPKQSSRIVPHIELVFGLEDLAEVINQHFIKITPTKVWVKRCGENLMDDTDD